MKRHAPGAAVALALAAGCVPGQSTGSTPPTENAPMNECPQFACSAYTYSGAAPQCDLPSKAATVSQCLVSQSVFPGLVYVVSMSADAGYAPGQTFLIKNGQQPYVDGDLFANPKPNCQPPGCSVLPTLVFAREAYVVNSATQVTLDWNLGHPGALVALPVHATFEPFFDGVDAASLGLPVTPVAAYVTEDTSVGGLPGPGNGPSLAFQANLQQGTYAATISPDPPFDAAFPPDVNTVAIGSSGVTAEDLLQYDYTSLETEVPPGPSGVPPKTLVPTFDLSPFGELVGWTAYLRDATTRQRISALATVGKGTTTVLLPTNHHPSTGDALDNAEFVLAPPAGKPIPTYIASSQLGGLDYSQTFPALPPPVTVSGAVTAADQVTPVEAELVFESIAGAASTQGIYVAGTPPTLNPDNFEYTAYVAARAATPGGASTYSVTLPPGYYQLTVVPLDTADAIAVYTTFDVEPGTQPVVKNVAAGAPLRARGYAMVADGRSLGGATVEAVPTGCFQATGTACTPRGGMTTTAADGSYALALDPGSYALRIEPADGTGFPWVVQSLLMQATDVAVPTATVPAPLAVTLALHDPGDNAVIDAVVRAYELPSKGQAIEIGRAITDATGTFTMYLTPTSQ